MPKSLLSFCTPENKQGNIPRKAGNIAILFNNILSAMEEFFNQSQDLLLIAADILTESTVIE